jgi:hypothetical protein
MSMSRQFRLAARPEARIRTELNERTEMTKVLDRFRLNAWEDKADAYGDAAVAWLEGGFARVGGDV